MVKDNSLISIILPCYFPPDDWISTAISALQKFKELVPSNIELIIVNDGWKGFSEMKTVDAFQNLVSDVQVISYSENKGKGYALRQGVAASTGDLVIFTDIDFPYTVESMKHISDALSNNNIAVGIKNKEYYSLQPAIRSRISKLLILGIKTLFRLQISDTQCGLKGFDQKGAQLFLKTQTNRYLFDLEFIKLASKNKGHIRMVAIPVQLREGVEFRKMNKKIILQELKNFIRILFR